MQSSGPRSLLLDGKKHWPPGAGVGVTLGESGLWLAAAPAGPLGLRAAPERVRRELAGLTLPRGMAFDAIWRLYLLTRHDAAIRRYDPESCLFVPLPALGGKGTGARQFRDPVAIAIARDLLYVVDAGSHRLTAFGLRALGLRHGWTTAEGRSWTPVDVASHDGDVFVLDGPTGRVFRHRTGTDILDRVVDPVQPTGVWSRLAIDRDGRTYLLDAQQSRLVEVGRNGVVRASFEDAGSVRDRFDPPPIRLDDSERFCLAPSLARACDRRPSDSPPSPGAPLAACRGDDCCGRIFGLNGERAPVLPSEPSAQPLYLREGTWVSEPLDSGIARCQWHRVELELGALPVGTRVEVRTFAGDTRYSAEEMLTRDKKLWEETAPFEGELERPGAAARPFDGRREFLVQNRPGRYLWLRVTLVGDGRRTPEVRRIRVHFPRDSYLQYLPAVFSEDEESRWFLERFLALFQTEWEALEQTIAETPKYTNPATVPAGDFLNYLAEWIGLPLEGVWNDGQKRRLLTAAPAIYPRRGTIDGLRAYLRVYLENVTGLDLSGFEAFPMIVEGFRDRNHLMLGDDAGTALGAGQPLWGPGVVGRLQLGVNARADEGKLIGTGDPERDVFHRYAHRFRVFAPAVWVQTDEAEQMVRRALDEEKPGHTQYELCLVESRFQLGLQSTLGFDTIVGDYPTARLGGWPEGDAAPRHRPHNRLGHDTILACPDEEPVAQLAPGIRLGAASPFSRV